MKPTDSGDPLTQTQSLGSSADVQAQIRSLQLLFIVTVAALVLLTLGVNLFIWRQMSLIRRQVGENRKGVADYQFRTREFFVRLQQFAGAHRDFQPILYRYAPPRQLETLGITNLAIKPAQ